MKFEELEKLQIEKWDGKPIMCYVNQGPTNEITPDSVKITKVVSFNAEAQHPWGDNRGRVYHSVYPVHPNGDCIKSLGSLRMTNRQLAMWLSKGNGQVAGGSHVYVHHCYNSKSNPDDDFVSDGIKVRKWDSEEWIEPTVDLLEDCK